jgi:hypothetical protein
MGLNTVRSCRKQLQRFARVMRVELFGALLRRYVGYPPEIRPNPGTWYSRGAALILAKRRADAQPGTTRKPLVEHDQCVGERGWASAPR